INTAPFLLVDVAGTGYQMTGGQLNLAGAGSLGALIVGYGSSGVMKIGNVSTDTPAVTTASDVYVGYTSGATGTITHNGGTVTIADTIGPQRTLFLGRASSSSGTYVLHGGTLDIHGNLQIGFSGHGTFIQDGGTA